MTKDDERTPNPVDLYVGGRIRMRRRSLGVSQEKLAEDLGLTFQQVQIQIQFNLKLMELIQLKFQPLDN